MDMWNPIEGAPQTLVERLVAYIDRFDPLFRSVVQGASPDDLTNDARVGGFVAAAEIPVA